MSSLDGSGTAEWVALGDRVRRENFANVGPHPRPEARVKQNNIAELTNILFEQLDALQRSDMTPEELQMEILRGQAISSIAAQILKSGDLMLKATTLRTGNTKKFPKLLE